MVEQPAIPEQDHQKFVFPSNGTIREQSPKSCLARLSNTWRSEVRNLQVETTTKCRWCQVSGQHEVLGTNSAARLQEVKSNAVSLTSLMIALSRGESLRLQTSGLIENFRKDPRTFGRHAWQRHTQTSRFHETRRNAVGGTQRCGQ